MGIKSITINLKAILMGLPSSIIICGLGWSLFIFGFIFFRHSNYFDSLLATAGIFFITAFIFLVRYDYEEVGSPISKFRIVYNKLKDAKFVLLVWFFFSSLIVALAYSYSLKVISSTMNLPPSWFSSSIAFITPIVSLYFLTLEVMFFILIFMCTMFLLEAINMLLKAGSFFKGLFFLFYALFLTLVKKTSEEEQIELLYKAQLKNVKSLTTFSQIFVISSALCFSTWACFFMGDILFDEQYLKLRKSVIVFLDYSTEHHCDVGEGFSVMLMDENTVSTAIEENGEWEIALAKCNPI